MCTTLTVRAAEKKFIFIPLCHHVYLLFNQLNCYSVNCQLCIVHWCLVSTKSNYACFVDLHIYAFMYNLGILCTTFLP